MKPHAIRSSNSLSTVFTRALKILLILLLAGWIVYFVLVLWQESLGGFNFPIPDFSFGYEQASQVSDKLIDFSESVDKTGKAFYKSFRPSFTCPPHLLKRVGGSSDGGKWTCGFTKLGRPNGHPITTLPSCLVYSFGVSRNSAFEAEILANTNCDVYAFDPTVDKIGHPLQPTNPRVHFQKWGIGAEDKGPNRTLKTLMERNGGHEWIDILKIDVEGAEYSSLNKVLEDFPEENGVGLPFGQLLLEVHISNWGTATGTNTENPKAQMLINFLKKLESRGLRLFSNEYNKFSKSQCCSEVSFINTKKFALNRFLDESTE